MKITEQHFAQCAVCQHYRRVRHHLGALNVVAVCEACLVSHKPQELMDAVQRAMIERGIAQDPSVPIIFHIMNGPERSPQERN